MEGCIKLKVTRCLFNNLLTCSWVNIALLKSKIVKATFGRSYLGTRERKDHAFGKLWVPLSMMRKILLFQ